MLNVGPRFGSSYPKGLLASPAGRFNPGEQGGELKLFRQKKTELKVYRRHEDNCRLKEKGPEAMKCSCPLWVYGWLKGARVRKSLGMRNLQQALRHVQQLEDPNTPELKPITEAVAAYRKHIFRLEPGTQKRYDLSLRGLTGYCETEGLKYIADLTVEHLDAYYAQRTWAPATVAKDIDILRMVLHFCQDRKWIAENPALKIQRPQNIKLKEVVPYTPEEFQRILAACDVIGVESYERLRARAMVLLLRYTGLRISDVSMLSKDRIREGRIFLYAQKNGGKVFLRIPQVLEDALAVLPAPLGAPRESRRYFWNERSLPRTMVREAGRTLRSVFKRSGVARAHPHRFRHTLATDILAKPGKTIDDVAAILGISRTVAEKHYVKWSRERQERIDEVIMEVHSEAFGIEAPKKVVQNVYSKKIPPVIN